MARTISTANTTSINAFNPLDGAAPNTDAGNIILTSSGGGGPTGSGNADTSIVTGNGNDTITAENFIWQTAQPGGDIIAFSNITTNGGDDLVELTRSAWDGTISTGTGNDTLNLIASGGNQVNMGGNNDEVNIIPDGGFTPTQAELEQKVGAAATNIDGSSGIDTLNLDGDWTLNLATFTNATLTNGNVVTSLTSADVPNIVGFSGGAFRGTVTYGTLTLDSGSTIAQSYTVSNFESLGVVCFTAGTMIETPTGEKLIETLREGDMVVTRNGIRPLRWIGRRRLDVIDLAANPNLLPVFVPAGAFGDGLPKRDVRFSPQHRVVVRSKIAARMFDAQEVLVAVKQLVGHNGIEVDGDAREVMYYHLMTDDHDIVRAEGLEAETLYPGQQAKEVLSDDAMREIMAIFPDFEERMATAQDKAALPMIKGRQGRALAQRHTKNNVSLWS